MFNDDISIYSPPSRILLVHAFISEEVKVIRYVSHSSNFKL
jgi:hypothetical protein